MLVSQAALSKPSIYGQCDYTILEMSALLFFLIVTLLRSVEECLLVVPQPALSLGLSTGLPHDSWRLLEGAKTIPDRYSTTVSSIRSFHFGELSSYPQTSTPSISLEVPKKCVAGVSPNSSLTTSLKITLLLSGMQFVELLLMPFDMWLCSLYVLEHYPIQTNPGIDCTHPFCFFRTGIT